MWKTLNGPQVSLVLGLVAIGVVVIIGVPAWAVVRGYVPPAFLFGPLGTVLIAGSAAFATYIKGQHEVPPWMEDPKIQRVLQSMRPAPMDVDISGLEISIPSLKVPDLKLPVDP